MQAVIIEKLKVNSYTFNGRNTTAFMLPSLLMGVNSESNKVTPLGDDYFLEGRPICGRVSLTRETNRKPQKLSPFVSSVGKVVLLLKKVPYE